MDPDLEGLYEDDGEFYDTLGRVQSGDSSNQHHSTPTLQKPVIANQWKVHSSAPNLENDVNQCNVSRQSQLDQSRAFANKLNSTDTSDDFEQGIYMNTTLHAERKLSVHSSTKQIPNTSTPRLDEFKRLTEVSVSSPEEYYMAPPPLPNRNEAPIDEAASFKIDSPNCDSPVFYDAPSKPDHSSLPPIPHSSDPLQFIRYELDPTGPSEAAPESECLYEGICDGDVNQFYEGLGQDNEQDNLYEGLDPPGSEGYYEGLKDSDDDGFYEGLPDHNDVFYEGVTNPDSSEPDASIKGLIDSMRMSDMPYVPPAPPKVPLRQNMKHLQALPQIPTQNTEISDDVNVKKSPSLQHLSRGSPPTLSAGTDHVHRAFSMVDMTTKPSSALASSSSESIDALYDGIDINGDDLKELEETPKDNDSHASSRSSFDKKRSYSFKDKMKKTKERTSSHIGLLKETVNSTIKENKSKWKDSKARKELKQALKETRSKAAELKTGTEMIYSSSITALRSRRVPRRKTMPDSVEEEERRMSQHSSNIELEESINFKSLQPWDVGSEAGTEYTLESSAESKSRGATSRATSFHSPERESFCDTTLTTVEDPTRQLSFESTAGESLEEYTPMEPLLSVGGEGQSFDGDQVMAATVTELQGTPMSDRHKVLQQILDHEYRYIMALKDMMKVYATPLQHNQSNKNLIEPSVAHEIFYRIPEITVHHEFFYEQLRRRSMTWSRHQSLGDILLQLFHKPGLFFAYASYMDNFNQALEIVRETRAARPAFSKLLDKLRNKSNQLSLEDLIYLPVDHVPVYLELLKELIKQTTQDDPDYTYLYLAKDEVEKLIEKLEERRAQADKSYSVKLLEKKISGLPHRLIAPQRYIICVEKLRELDIMTDCSDGRFLVVMSDLLLCLKPTTARTSSSVMSMSGPKSITTSAEYHYLWDALITDVEVKQGTAPALQVEDDKPEEADGYQALKDDLTILKQIDELRKQLKSSYTSIRFDKLAEVQEKLCKEIAERQVSEESRRGRVLDIVRPINSPCTSTQFHRFIFSTAVRRSKWAADFISRAETMQHTKDLDWCQVGEESFVNRDRLATLLPVIKHMTPIGLTTPSHFSVECAVANADFTCPVTQDILYRIMSNSNGTSYMNVEEGDIPILPPGAAPRSDTPVYDESLTIQQPSSLPNLSPLRPKIIDQSAKSPYAIDESLRSPPQQPEPSETTAPPLPDNHPAQKNSLNTVASNNTDRLSLIEMMQGVPKEFNIDDGETNDENLYETPYEISLLRAQKRKMMRTLSVDDRLLGSTSDLSKLPGCEAEETFHTPGQNAHSLDHLDFEDSVDEEESLIEANEGEDEKLNPSFVQRPGDVSRDQVSLTKLENLNLADFPDESFTFELTETLSLEPTPGAEDTMQSNKSDGSSAPLLVDKYGQIYTDKIASLISGPGMVVPEESLEIPGSPPQTSCTALSLCELDTDDEDDTPRYTSQLNLAKGPDSMNLSGGKDSMDSQLTPQNPASLLSSPPTMEALPQIIVPESELPGGPARDVRDNTPGRDGLYENVEEAKKIRTKVIRRESSKRSISRRPLIARSSASLASDDWQEPDEYENINEELGHFELKSTDVFLCGHGQSGTGEIVVLRMTEPTPHVALNLALKASQVLCCQMVPGNTNNTLWIGTQDARLLVYNMEDPSSTLIEHSLEGGPVICINHIEDSVFVGTSEGYIHVFTRDEVDELNDSTVNEWCDNDPLSKKLGSSSICAMLPIGGHMWCSCGSQIFVISPKSATVEHLFSTHNNTSAQVYKMVNSGSGVWLAIRNSPVIRLFHAKTGEHMEDYDISTLVHHLFTGSQNAARRRRSENVRVTALLASPSTGALWIGTSSGVVIVVPIVKPPTAPKICGPPFLSYVGHYDGVRFLVQAQSTIQKLIVNESTEEESVYEETTSQVIMSCGKGMEDFRDLTSGSIEKSHDIQNSSYLITWHYPLSEENS